MPHHRGLPTSEALTVRVRLDESDLAHFFDRHHRARLMLLAIVVTAILLFVGMRVGHDAWAAAALAPLAMLFGLHRGRRRWIAQRLERFPRGHVRYSFRLDGLAHDSLWDEGHTPWSAFSGYREDTAAFYLHRGRSDCFFIPKRVLGSGGAERVRALLRHAVRKI